MGEHEHYLFNLDLYVYSNMTRTVVYIVKTEYTYWVMFMLNIYN